MMDNFFKTISEFSPLSQESRKAFTLVMKSQELPAGHILLKPHSVCNYLYFIEQGLTRTFYYKEDKDVTDWISPENAFAVSIVSFITRKPDRRGIELLEDSRLNSIHHDELEKLCSRYHDIEKITRHLVSSGLIQLQEKFDDLHFSTASQRYQMLITKHPTFIQRVPLGMIASYLGITQETLSRIRAQI
jgi:CRP-like cAMP-binding protein